MPNIVFVAPFLMETTLRFVNAVAAVPGAQVVLVTQDSEDRVPPRLRGQLRGVERVSDALDAGEIAAACSRVSDSLGGVDRVLGTLEELQVPLGQVREHLGLGGIGAAAAANFRDKARMKDVLQAAGLPCARHRRVTSTEEVWRFVADVGYPLVFKPTAGSGSRGTFRVASDEQLHDVLRWQAPSPDSVTMLEEFVQGEEHSFDSVFLGGRVVWHSYTDYLPGPLQVLENPWIQWCVVLPRERQRPDVDEFRPLAEQALLALGMQTGLSHMEWFRTPGGRYAISEVGARPPGAQITSIISFAHDIDMYAAWGRLVVLDQFEPPERPFAAGCVYLRGQGGERIRAVHGLEEAQQQIRGLAVEVKLPKPGQARAATYEGDGYVIVRHPQTEVVHEALAALLQTIKVETGP